MLTILILLNIVTITVLIVTILLYNIRIYRSKQLFVRAWKLELTLISIYDRSSAEIKLEIEKVLDTIKQLD
jgi:hypothetical protein